MKILIVGGDKRMLYAKTDLEKNGFKTDTLGLIENDNADIFDADILLLPVPATRDNININCPLTQRKIPISLLQTVSEDTLILSGGLNLKRKNFINYLELEDYAILGAVPTAEGAIHCAIENTDFTLWNSNILIIGFGKVSRILASRLVSFGCNLTVSARNNRDFSYLDALNISKISTYEVNEQINNFDIVFNTIDVPIIDSASLSKETLIIDLSTKGCFIDNNPKVNLIKLPGLPGKIAPATAGKIISETAIKLINGQRR